MNRTSRYNALLGAGLASLVVGFAVFPAVFQKRHNHNYTHQKEPLSPNLAMRGAYINSGSCDIGADPNWQIINGRRVNLSRDMLSSVSEAEIAAFRRIQQEKKEAAGASK